jgi:hypothetical protein
VWTATRSWRSCGKSLGGEATALPSGGACGSPLGRAVLRGDPSGTRRAVLRCHRAIGAGGPGAADFVPDVRSACATAFRAAVQTLGAFAYASLLRGGRRIDVHADARTDEVPVAVDIVDAADGGPEFNGEGERRANPGLAVGNAGGKLPA